MNLAAHIETLQLSLRDRDMELLTAKQLLKDALSEHKCSDKDCWCHKARRLIHDNI